MLASMPNLTWVESSESMPFWVITSIMNFDTWSPATQACWRRYRTLPIKGLRATAFGKAHADP